MTAVLKASPQDFVVEEQLSVEFSGDGEFDWLFVEKVDRNTQDVAKDLAKHAGVADRDVSWSGLKDKRAVSRQWFSVHLPGKKADWQGFPGVLKQVRHRKKCRRGTHSANQFQLCLRDVKGNQGLLDQQLIQLRQGAPNYFGEQRFGRNASNLERAERWFAGGRKPSRQQKSMQLSAARSFLFNCVLAERVKEGSWALPLEGDVFMLNGSRSVFQEPISEEVGDRLRSGDIHSTGPLYGDASGLVANGPAGQLESTALQQFEQICSGLKAARVDADRRALRMLPANFEWNLSSDQLNFTVTLPTGCFCTTLVREFADYSAVAVLPPTGQS